MPVYQYQVRQQRGAVSTGQITAGSFAQAAAVIRDQGGFLVDLREAAGSRRSLLTRFLTYRPELGPGLKDVMGFTSQLSVMIKAGISIRDAVVGVCEQVENLKFKAMLEQVRQDVEGGRPFSEALARYPRVFGPLYVNMVRASEMSGNFGHMLERIADYLRQQVETRSMVRGAMIYPAIIGTMAIGTTVFLLTFVLPRFQGIFKGKESLLPAPTVILLATSFFLRHYWYLVIGALAGLIGGFLYFIRTPVGHRWWDTVKLKLPLLKKMFRALYISRGLQTMGEMVNAGVPMLETLKITSEVAGNENHQQLWMAVFRSVKAGNKIADPLSRSRLLPRNVVQMISAGEESGNLGKVLADVSEFYHNELKNTIKAVTAMLEPLMIVLMGGVVGFIAMSIILPIFKMSQLAK